MDWGGEGPAAGTLQQVLSWLWQWRHRAGMLGTASEGGPICALAVPAASALSGIGLWRRPGVGVRGKGWANGRTGGDARGDGTRGAGDARAEVQGGLGFRVEESGGVGGFRV